MSEDDYMKVYISPSNQPNNRCVIGHSEKDHAIELANKIVKHLPKYGVQFKIGDSVKMESRVAEATRWGAELYMPLHTNATSNGRARGTTFGFYPGRADSMKAGVVFKKHWVKLYPLPNLVRVGNYNFYEARAPKCPSVYTELLFHDNFDDAKWLHANMDKIAENLADAIADYFGVYGTEDKPEQKSIVDGFKVKMRLTREENLMDFGKRKNDIVELDIEEYLKGVVPREIGNPHIEAAKAQAIASRSLVYYWVTSQGSVSDNTGNQIYSATARDNPAFNRAFAAIEQTKGQVLTYEGKVVQAYFADSNGGQMKSSKDHWVADLPYLVTKEDPWTKASGKPFNGHPVGMSQQGAIWAANNGITHEEILAFYYPGTEIHPSGSSNSDAVNPTVVLYKAEAVTRNPLSLNIWAAAYKGKSLKLIPRGATVDILEEVSPAWAFVEYEGVKGFVDRQYLKKLPDKQDDTQGNKEDAKPAPEQKPEEKPSDVLYRSVVRTRLPLSLNLWREANKVASIRKIPNGATVDVLKEVTSIWAKVRYNGSVGYVDRQYLEKEGKPQQSVLYKAEVKTVYPLSLNIWREPRRGISLTKVPRGAEVSVLEEVSQTWAKVSYGQHVGYSDRKYLIKKGN